MAWWYAVIESRHELQNPTSPEKILALGRELRLEASSHVLDIAGGRGGPASLLAGKFGCRITSVERAPEIAAAARERGNRLVEVVECDAKDFDIEPAGFDAAICLGASFAFDGLVPTVQALVAAVPPRGRIAVGEPYWRVWPLPEAFAPDEYEGFLPLAQTVERFEQGGAELVSLIDSSLDDWDRHASLRWSTLDEWLAANPDDPQADEFRERGRLNRDRYLRWTRELLGWAIFVGRVR